MYIQKVYDKFKAWIKNHPNHNAYSANTVCPNCGSSKLQKRGSAVNLSRHYQRFQCQGCGKWSRSVKSEQVTKESVISI